MIPLVRFVLPVLKTTPQRWVQLASKLSPELFQRKPAPTEWSAYDCLRHIVDTERSVFPPRLGYLLRGRISRRITRGKRGKALQRIRRRSNWRANSPVCGRRT